MIDFEQRVSELEVGVGAERAGELRRRSQYEFDYADEARAPISLIMPVADRAFRDGELFAVMDMNLPEGFLLAQLRERSPKQPPTKMQLLALMGSNGIGRLSYRTPAGPQPRGPPVSRARLMRQGVGKRGALFRELVDAWLSTGSGLSGVQPKILVAERATLPIPNLLVKTAGDDYPHLAANEFLCLEAARRAGIETPAHDLSDDGSLLVLDRFDLRGSGRLGFEDLAALLDLRVGGALSDRKYKGSYEAVARLLTLFCTAPSEALAGFFDQLALSVLVQNGDAHLKNFGVLYDGSRCWLSPLFDVVTTTLYSYERAGLWVTDQTMALKLNGTRRYPLHDELVAFGRAHCGVDEPARRLEAIRDAMADTLRAAASDERVPRAFLKRLRAVWDGGGRGVTGPARR